MSTGRTKMWRDASELSIEAKSKTYFYDSDVAIVKPIDLQKLIDAASNDPLKKARLCLHSNVNHTLHDMIIASNCATYVSPHKHDHSSVYYNIIQGSMGLVIFNNEGNIKEYHKLEMGKRDQVNSVRINPGIWHSEIYISEWVIFSESVLSPLGRKNAFVNPTWSPGDDRNVQIEFMDKMRKLFDEK